MRSGGAGVFLVCSRMSGCSANGAPSFDLFGAFFPAWLLCGIAGIAGAVVARVAFVSSGVANILPYQPAVCTAIGVITALLFWPIGFGH
jgi:YtcA family